VWAPQGLDPDPYLTAFAQGRAVFPAPAPTITRLKLALSFLRATRQPHAALDDGSLVVSRGMPEPQVPGHLRWAEYETLEEVTTWLGAHAEELQLVAAAPRLHARLQGPVPVVPLGETQRPPPGWQPDGVDTLGWLAGL
jgi:hypothetical protein